MGSLFGGRKQGPEDGHVSREVRLGHSTVVVFMVSGTWGDKPYAQCVNDQPGQSSCRRAAPCPSRGHTCARGGHGGHLATGPLAAIPRWSLFSTPGVWAGLALALPTACSASGAVCSEPGPRGALYILLLPLALPAGGVGRGSRPGEQSEASPLRPSEATSPHLTQRLIVNTR